MLVDMHHEDCSHESQEVSDEGCIEVQAGLSLHAAVETKEQSNEDSWNDDVTKTQHGEVAGVEAIGEKILGEHELDRGFEALGDCHHDVCSKHPEDVINEESAEENAAGDDVVEMKKLNSIDGESEAEQVVCNPMFLKQIPHANHSREHKADDVVRCELVIDQILIHSFCELNVEWREWNGRWHNFADNRSDEVS